MNFLKVLYLVGVPAMLATVVVPTPDQIITNRDKDHIIVKYGENGQVLKINDPDDPKNSKLTSIEVKNKTISLIAKSGANETAQLKFDVLPFNASREGFKYTSSNEAVAKVNDSGLITAVAAGKCEITVSNADGSIKDSAHVVVNKTTSTKVANRVNAILTAQESMEDLGPVFISEQYYSERKTDAGVVKSSSGFTENFWIDQANSYFRITSTDFEAKCEGGSIEQSRNDYIFYTDSLFYTYIYKTNGNKKTYMVIDQSSKTVDPEFTRYKALCEVIGNFFTSGEKVITQQLAMVKGTSTLQLAIADSTTKGKQGITPGSDKYGFLAESEDAGQFMYQYESVSGGRVGQEDATALDIPVNTVVTMNDTMRFVWENNIATQKHISEVMTFTAKKVNYINTIDVDYYIETEDVETFIPTSGYKKVDTIFDL
ncbi:MAG: Ig-like domain-containing protein [Bacilli bacterium]|nr:Ig-like domain-containing protein [Bacilli bacterium]